MNTLEKLRSWGGHHPAWLTVLRVALGLILIWKGIQFILNLDVLAHFLRQTGLTDKIGASAGISLLAQLIIAFHLIGGVGIMAGLRTRFFCLLNLPVLLVAVCMVNLRQNLFRPYSELWLSLLVMFALTFFLIEGDGTALHAHKTQHAV